MARRSIWFDFIQFWVDSAWHWIVQSHRCYFRIYRCWYFSRESPLVRTTPFSPYADVAIERQIDSREPGLAQQFYLYWNRCRRRCRDPCRATSNRLSLASILPVDFETRFLPAIFRREQIVLGIPIDCNWCREFDVFTWTSLSFRLVAIWLRSVRLKYFFAWNSRSNSSNCSDVKAVRRRRDFKLCFECVLFDSFVFSSPEHSLSDWSERNGMVFSIW